MRRRRNVTHHRLGPRLGPLVMPDWLLVAVVCLVPIGFMVVRSFARVNPVTLDVELTGTVKAYRTLLSPVYRPVALRSLIVSALTVVLCLVIGTPAALALSRLKGSARSTALIAVMLPSFVSFTVRILAWQGVLATGGPVESITGAQLLYRPPAVLLGMITAYVPLFILPAYVALTRVPIGMIEAAADLGAASRRRLLRIVLPLALPGIVTGAAIVGVLAVGEFIVPAVLGGGKVLLLGNILAERGAGRDQPLGGAITTFTLVTFAAGAAVVLIIRRRSVSAVAGAPMRDRGRVATAMLTLVLVVLYTPLLFLVVASVNRNPASTGWRGFSTRWYHAAFADPALRRALSVSVRLAVSSALVAVAVGTAAAVAARHSRWLRRVNALLATVRVATPEIIIATGLGAALPVAGVAFGFRPMLVAHIAYLSAYVLLIVGARASGADPTIEEAAMDLGASRSRVLRKIVLPDLRPAVVSSGLLTMAFSFDDVALSLALRGPKDTTVPIYIFSAVQRRVSPSIHAIGAVIIAAGVTVFAVAFAVNRAIADGGARTPVGTPMRTATGAPAQARP